MDEFVSLFGNITVATIVQWAVALGFLFMSFKKFKEYLDKKLTEEAETKTAYGEYSSSNRATPANRRKNYKSRTTAG